MTCKDCIHYDMCSGFTPTDLDRDAFDYCREGRTDEIPDIEERCTSFKDKSLFIESPCKVGDKVYAISNTRVKETKIVEIYVGKDNIISFQAYFDCDEDCDGCPFESWSQSYCGEWDCGGQYGNTIIVAKDFGKTVFLTIEEAEAELQKRGDVNAKND